MPFKTQYGSHYHETYGCHGATIPCDSAGLSPCSDCCGEGGGGAGSPLASHRSGVPSVADSGETRLSYEELDTFAREGVEITLSADTLKSVEEGGDLEDYLAMTATWSTEVAIDGIQEISRNADGSVTFLVQGEYMGSKYDYLEIDEDEDAPDTPDDSLEGGLSAGDDAMDAGMQAMAEGSQPILLPDEVAEEEIAEGIAGPLDFTVISGKATSQDAGFVSIRPVETNKGTRWKWEVSYPDETYEGRTTKTRQEAVRSAISAVQDAYAPGSGRLHIRTDSAEGIRPEVGTPRHPDAEEAARSRQHQMAEEETIRGRLNRNMREFEKKAPKAPAKVREAMDDLLDACEVVDVQYGPKGTLEGEDLARARYTHTLITSYVRTRLAADPDVFGKLSDREKEDLVTAAATAMEDKGLRLRANEAGDEVLRDLREGLNAEADRRHGEARREWTRDVNKHSPSNPYQPLTPTQRARERKIDEHNYYSDAASELMSVGIPLTRDRYLVRAEAEREDRAERLRGLTEDQRYEVWDSDARQWARDWSESGGNLERLRSDLESGKVSRRQAREHLSRMAYEAATRRNRALGRWFGSAYDREMGSALRDAYGDAVFDIMDDLGL